MLEDIVFVTLTNRNDNVEGQLQYTELGKKHKPHKMVKTSGLTVVLHQGVRIITEMNK